ncbi:MAG TPA: hypothetical protein VMB84_03360 [Stellaceae bacterium]|nr:hypothetical protein [Stellaceae bacterium]
MPQGTPDAVADPTSFFADAKEVAATEMTVSLTARAAGASEVRLYYTPHFGTSYVVAARAPITVTGP